MFTQAVNTPYINDLFSAGTMPGMRADAPHPSFQRLLAAMAIATAGLPTSSRVADEARLRGALDISPQTANNWKSRGVSADAALQAQRRYAVSATWVLDAAEPQLIGGPMPPAQPEPPSLAQTVSDLADALAADMSDAVREDLADALAKLARRRGSTHDRLQVLQLLVPALPRQVVDALSGGPALPAQRVKR